MPRTEHQEKFVVSFVFWLDSFVESDRAINIFLVPQTVHHHGRDGERFRRKYLVHRLLAPERVVIRMLYDLAPEAYLVHPTTMRESARRSAFQVHVVIVVMARPPLLIVVARCLLVVDIRQVLLP